MLAATAKPNALWPPDHRMVVVNLSAVVVDGCSATSWKITGVRSSEPVNGRGAGKASVDWTIIDDIRFSCVRNALVLGQTGFTRLRFRQAMTQVIYRSREP